MSDGRLVLVYDSPAKKCSTLFDLMCRCFRFVSLKKPICYYFRVSAAVNKFITVLQKWAPNWHSDVRNVNIYTLNGKCSRYGFNGIAHTTVTPILAPIQIFMQCLWHRELTNRASLSLCDRMSSCTKIFFTWFFSLCTTRSFAFIVCSKTDAHTRHR